MREIEMEVLSYVKHEDVFVSKLRHNVHINLVC